MKDLEAKLVEIDAENMVKINTLYECQLEHTHNLRDCIPRNIVLGEN